MANCEQLPMPVNRRVVSDVQHVQLTVVGRRQIPIWLALA